MESPQSLGVMLRNSCAKYAGKTAMIVPGGIEISYAQLYEEVERNAAALKELAAVKGDRIVILSENCPEWAYADWAAQTLGVVVVPIYPTLPADQAQYIVKDCGAKLVLAGAADQMAKTAGMEGVKTVLLKGEGSLQDLSKTAKLHREAWEKGMDTVDPESMAIIIYTSGTTGLPKGAMLAHKSLLWVGHAVTLSLPIDDKDTFFCFLPMSHVFEQVDGQILPISLGATIGFNKSLMTMASDLQKIKPTIFLCVPRVLEAMKDKAMEGIAKQKPIKQKLFALALSQGIRKFKGQFAPLQPLTDKLVGEKIRGIFGGRMRFLVAGGAAMPPPVAEFYGAFGLTVLQGFGLTETASGVVINRPENNKYWTVGEPLPGIECKIAEDGEILLRGPMRMIGYYNLPEETTAAIDEDGWFRTGDIGEFEGKHLKITDRKKDLIVLGNGKNVAPQAIENKLRGSQFIQEAVVLGDNMEYCCALIVPNFEAVRKELGLGPDVALATSPEVKAFLKKEIDAVNKTLAPFEIVKKFAVLEKAFTIDSGEMTPTLKVKRKVVKERYAKEIAGLRG